MRHRRCPACGHVAPDIDLRYYAVSGRGWRRRLRWCGYKCLRCGCRGEGRMFLFATPPQAAALRAAESA